MPDCRFQWRHLVTFSDEAIRGVNFARRNTRFGRKPSLTSHQREEALARLANGEAQADVARSYDVSQSTISRLAP